MKSVLVWIDADRTEDRVNAKASTKMMGMPALSIATMSNQLVLMTLLLQLGADVDCRVSDGGTAIGLIIGSSLCGTGDANKMVRLLLCWGG